ncbi:hypothetical protein, partial [Streptomyces muensis]
MEGTGLEKLDEGDTPGGVLGVLGALGVLGVLGVLEGLSVPGLVEGLVGTELVGTTPPSPECATIP